MVLPAIILNEPYAELVKMGIKTIETRMRLFKFTGDIIICCDKGKSRASVNAGNALCIVHWNKGRLMTDEDVVAACIENAPKRYAYPLTNRRLFDYDFKIKDYVVTKNFQGIFSVRIPDFVKIINPNTPSDK